MSTPGGRPEGLARERARAAVLAAVLGLALALAGSSAARAQSPADSAIRQGTEAHGRGDLRAAAALFAEAVRLDPDNARAQYNLCATHLSLGDGARFVDHCSRAIRLDPGYSLAYYVRGVIRSQEMGDLNGGIQDLGQAIRLKPDHAPAYLKRGNARVRSGDVQGGLADYDRTIVLEPRWADAHHNRGVVRYNLGDSRGALEDLAQAARLAKDQGDQASYERARAAIQQVQSQPR
jgi:tetratricopeptide (TPR) repeat protein